MTIFTDHDDREWRAFNDARSSQSLYVEHVAEHERDLGGTEYTVIELTRDDLNALLKMLDEVGR